MKASHSVAEAREQDAAGFAVLDAKGRVSLPKVVRQALGVQAGTALDYAVRDGMLWVRPASVAASGENGTTERQRVIRTALGSLARAQAALEIAPPALLIVGETARFAERYSWFEPSRVEFFEDESAQARARVSY